VEVSGWLFWLNDGWLGTGGRKKRKHNDIYISNVTHWWFGHGLVAPVDGYDWLQIGYQVATVTIHRHEPLVTHDNSHRNHHVFAQNPAIGWPKLAYSTAAQTNTQSQVTSNER
jgi:beta-xylosidase